MGREREWGVEDREGGVGEWREREKEGGDRG